MMSNHKEMLSDGEKDFIRQGCSMGIRLDGRGPKDHRTILIEPTIYPHVDGSCRVKIGDAFDVIVTAKCDIVEIYSTSVFEKNSVLMEVDVTLSPDGSPQILDDVHLLQMIDEVADNISRSINGTNSICRDQFCIIEGKYYWKLFLDLQILKYDGNPSYACSIGTYFALQQLKLPRSHKLFTDRGYDDFELDAHEYLQLDHSLLSINLVVGKLGSQVLLDPSLDEILCCDAVFNIAINKINNIASCSLIKCGAFPLEILDRVYYDCQKWSQSIFSQISGLR